jgi:hypothetical protein
MNTVRPGTTRRAWSPLTCPRARLRQRKLDEVERLRARERGQEAERQLKQRKLLRLEAAPKASRPGAPGLPPACQPVRALQRPGDAQPSTLCLPMHRSLTVKAVVHVLAWKPTCCRGAQRVRVEQPLTLSLCFDPQ